MAVEREAGGPWNEQTFFAEADARAPEGVAGLRSLFDSGVALGGGLDLVWGKGSQDPRFIFRRPGSSVDFISGWARGRIGVQVGSLRDLHGEDALAELASALGRPDYMAGAEPSFDSALMENSTVAEAMQRLLGSIAALAETEAEAATSIGSERASGAQRGANAAPAAPSTWLLLTFGDERQYAGNQGYEDDPVHVYRYDSFVPNYRQLVSGDAAVLKAPDRTLGCARIERIEEHDGTKERQRCPVCKTTAIKARRSSLPRYRSDSRHEFDEPTTEQVQCRKYAAHFGASFVPLTADVEVSALRAACRNHNGQLAMQRIDRALIAESTPLRALDEALKNIDGAWSAYIEPDDGEPGAAEASNADPPAPYAPSGIDTREAKMRQVRARRGQSAFRQALRAAYGDACMVTGCTLIDLVEAAHISPYRGHDDHHVENGLLLRADIHTLFDLDLLGIEPETLVIRLHPILRTPGSGYDDLDGRLLFRGERKPSRGALISRWEAFQRRLG